MVCAKCGHANPDVAQFCGKCGTGLPRAGGPGSRPSDPSPPGASATPAVSTEMKIGIIIATLVIPLLGIILGIIFLADANPQKKTVGRLWLLVGIGVIVLYCILAAMLGMLGSMTQGRSGRGTADEASSVQASLEAAIRHADTAEIQAQRELDERYLYPLYTGKALQDELAEIQDLRKSKIVGVMHLDGQVFDSFSVDPEGLRAAVHLVETWSGAYYSTESEKCLSRLPRHRTPQTIFLQRTATAWMIDSITFYVASPKVVECS